MNVGIHVRNDKWQTVEAKMKGKKILEKDELPGA